MRDGKHVLPAMLQGGVSDQAVFDRRLAEISFQCIMYVAQAADLPLDQWFNAQAIATSLPFADAISAGMRDCSIMLACHTDQYSSRPWCRCEVLDAKRSSAHILIVDALENGENRSFPYSGNVPVLRWRDSESEVDARRVIDRAVREALRFKHNRVSLQATAAPGERELPTAPEALVLTSA